MPYMKKAQIEELRAEMEEQIRASLAGDEERKRREAQEVLEQVQREKDRLLEERKQREEADRRAAELLRELDILRNQQCNHPPARNEYDEEFNGNDMDDNQQDYEMNEDE